MFKLCVFDMDGTVVNTIGDISSAMNRSLEAMGYNSHTEEEYCQMVGDGMTILCQRALPNADASETEQLINLYKKDYLENCCVKSVPYDGIIDVVRKLKSEGIICAILSNKPHNQVMEISDKLFDEGLFAEILGKKDEFPPKPAPDSLLYIMDKYNMSVGDIAYIGDSNVDIRLGKSVGAYSVGVAWGFRGAEELKDEKADAIAYNSEELYNILMKI